MPVYTVTATQNEDFYGEKYDRIPNIPMFPTITGPMSGELGDCYEYEVSYEDPEGDDVYFKINWGDGRIQNWDGPYKSGEVVNYSHYWSPISFPGGGNFNIVVQAKDDYNVLSRQSKIRIFMDGKNSLAAHPIISNILVYIANLLELIRDLINQ